MPETFDRLAALLERFRVRASLYHEGPLCGVTRFDAKPGRAFMHVMRSGTTEISHASDSGVAQRIVLEQPSVLLYPQPLFHQFQSDAAGSEFNCATLDFDGGENHPLVRALPKLLVLPIADVSGLERALDLLYEEADGAKSTSVPGNNPDCQLASTQTEKPANAHRCGHQLLVNRLFEVILLQLLRWLLQNRQHLDLPAGLLVGLTHPKLAKVLTGMHENPAAAWPLERMAQLAGMSRSAFAASFKTELATTPADYLSTWRLSLAQLELRRGVPAQRVALALGYGDAAALSRAHAQRFGLSTRAWLKLLDAVP
jgi:AraC-like DNA-binding protein